jgi:hypothetical protein
MSTLLAEDLLQRIVEEYRHVQGEHERLSEGSSLRRKREADLKELESHFETLLARWFPDEALRQKWRGHLFRGGPRPKLERELPPIFKGRSDAGSVLTVRPTDADEWEYVVDGTLEAHHPPGWHYGGPTRVELVGQQFDEVFDAPDDALEALRAHVSDPSDEPPWEWAQALFEDGLVDIHFSLTDRGRRAVGT